MVVEHLQCCKTFDTEEFAICNICVNTHEPIESLRACEYWLYLCCFSEAECV